jgi:hypothetical protein
MTGIGGDDAIVATIGKALQSKRTVSRRLLRERCDTCRADVPTQLVERIDVTVQLRVTADAVPELERGERWLRERFIGRIPGAGRASGWAARRPGR